MGNTFMFDCDRFGAEADCFGTYRSAGGAALSEARLQGIVEALLDRMLADARGKERYESFGTVASYLAGLPETRGVSPEDVERIEQVIAAHEVGRVPPAHASTLRSLRESHPLGLVSNVWSRRDVFERELRRAGVLDLFDARIWSSDHGCIKPAPRLFHEALARLGVAPGDAVYVGDHPMRDVAGAKAIGMGAVWVRNADRPLGASDPRPDLVIEDIVELVARHPTDF